ncbi:hypothetical protein D3218_13645 [Aureimonas flava]|uniref:Uncharacterized protein n=2 Tax=Aureimonas flava TaxID=2320271 RepID=A0A3A1WJU4_9HYPH|nr:hypothetical protein D3218_13645 [Aureimonas flava]
MLMGVTPNWSFNHNGTNHSYVRAHVPPRLGFGNTAMISRLILPPAVRGVVVRHRDGDRLNLQLSNLILSERMTGAQAWEATILNFMEAEEKRPIVPQPTALPLDLAGYPLLWL